MSSASLATRLVLLLLFEDAGAPFDSLRRRGIRVWRRLRLARTRSPSARPLGESSARLLALARGNVDDRRDIDHDVRVSGDDRLARESDVDDLGDIAEVAHLVIVHGREGLVAFDDRQPAKPAGSTASAGSAHGAVGSEQCLEQVGAFRCFDYLLAADDAYACHGDGHS